MTLPKTKLPTASGTSTRMKTHGIPSRVLAYSDWTALIEKNDRTRRYCQISRRRDQTPSRVSAAMTHTFASAIDEGLHLALLLAGVLVRLHLPHQPRGDDAAAAALLLSGLLVAIG